MWIPGHRIRTLVQRWVDEGGDKRCGRVGCQGAGAWYTVGSLDICPDPLVRNVELVEGVNGSRILSTFGTRILTPLRVS
jgi:hypothetical protein